MSSGLPPFMTTPELRQGPPPPYTHPSLVVNLVMRVFFGTLAMLCSWVPMRLLWKNGEFPAATYCCTVITLNLFSVVNALIWRDDNVKEWFSGYGWCDLQIYTTFGLQTLYSACIFATMRNLANKVGMMRATSLTTSEKRRRNLIEALIIFPFPLLQVTMTYFVLAQRYNVSTLVGCTNIYYRTWPYVVVYHVPTNTFTILTVVYGILTWWRYRQVEKSTETARGNTSSGMRARQQRIRRKLFFMCISTMAPFFPIQMLFLYTNIAGGLKNLRPYDFKTIHNPATFNLVTFRTSPAMSFLEMNRNYICIITVVPLFWYFGLTKEAINVYRVYCLNLGLGRFWPKLHEEYEPDRTRTNTVRSWGANISGFLKSDSRSGSSKSRSADNNSRKNSILPSFQHVSGTITTTTSSTSSRNIDLIEEHITITPAKKDSNPWQDITVPEPSHNRHSFNNDDDDIRPISRHNPFIFRTMLNVPSRLFTRHQANNNNSNIISQPPLCSGHSQTPLSDFSNHTSCPSQPHSHTRHPNSGSDTKSPVGASRPIESRDSSNDALPWATVNNLNSAGVKTSKGASAKVQTRVWSDEEERQLYREAEKRAAAAAGATSAREASDNIGRAVGGESAGVRIETRIARSEQRM
ncbi:pheromone A receptor-domain-containing protein [Coniochaeta sp. 2T2.1]|nr:pheromone A receptor-domain-containing protein [Coniochaeta sp. 2T2.1]